MEDGEALEERNVVGEVARAAELVALCVADAQGTGWLAE